MLTITSSSVERTSTVFKPSLQPTNPSNTSNTSTVSLQKPQAEQDKVSLSSKGIEKVNAPAAVEAPVNSYARTIVDFMRLQLQRDVASGASAEELTSRLAAGYQGFLQGYNDAYSQLGGTSALPDEVNQQLAETKAQVGEQVAKLAKDFGIKAPEIEQPTKTTDAKLEDALNHLLHTTNTDNLGALTNGGHNGVAQSRSLNLHLTTADGDIIELIANNQSSAAFKQSAQGINGRAEQSQQWSLSVQGDLNDQERGAITDFINQLGGLADEFYQGDLAQAVSQAQKLGFDHQQISEFSLSLQQVDIKRVQNAYSGPQSGSTDVKNPPQSRWQVLGQWLDQLDKLRTDSLNNALPKNWIEQLSQQSLTQWHPDNEAVNGFLVDKLADK